MRLPLRRWRGGMFAVEPSSLGPAPATFDLVRAELLLPPDVPIRGFSRGDAAIVLDRELTRLAAADARCRLVRARIVERLVTLRGWRTLGFVRLGDFARERLGCSPRCLEDDARVVRALTALPAMTNALESGDLSWTRVRVLVRAATPANERELLEASRAIPMRELEEWTRGFESAAPPSRVASSASAAAPCCAGDAATSRSRSTDSGGSASSSPQEIDETPAAQRPGPPATSIRDDDPLLRWSIDVSPTGRRLWRAACEMASRSAGSPLSPAQVLELVAAEGNAGAPAGAVVPRASVAASASHVGAAPVAAAQPSAPPAQQASLHRWTPPEYHEQRFREAIRARERRGRRGLLGFLAEYGAAEGFAWLDPASRDPGPAAAVEALLDGLAHADAFELERRLQQLRLLTQRLDAQMAALLRTGIDRRLFHELGFATVKLYAEARLGICARRVWSLVAIERHSWRTSRLLHEAWKSGKLTALQATALLPVFGERHAQAWIDRAAQVTLRRLSDEVAWALDHRSPACGSDDTPPPPLDAGIRADGTADVGDDEVQMRAHGAPPPSDQGVPGAVRLDFLVPLSVAVLVESTLDLLQRHREGRWHAFERMIALALLEWTSAPRHRDPVFERDGWRCAVPGCSSRRNLQDHHVVFRSHGGGNGRGNRITVCAGHHLHGIHVGAVRVQGIAPRGLHWQLGCARGQDPLLQTVGDRIVREARAGLAFSAPAAGTAPVHPARARPDAPGAR